MMPADNNATGPDGRVYDATRENWVDRFCPRWSRPYLRLARADRPIGTWLLVIPCWWAVSLAAVETGWKPVDLWLVVGSGIGALLMRGAGCTWNDITDRDIDGSVARTRSRPIPSGQVTARRAAVWMIALSLLAFLILLTFNGPAIAAGVASLGLVAIYPFAKRFTWWPQAFLGLAFNWGAILLWIAHSGSLGWPAIWLYGAGIAWTLHYDTVYAHQDREDDALIGVRSTARLFGTETTRWLWGFTIAIAIMAALALGSAGATGPAWAGLMLWVGFIGWQTAALDIDDADRCLEQFRACRWGGLIFLAGLVAEATV